ncbi:PTS sugar transporter subunit IIA [Exiguobacterium flavidum]|uniref:PTS sugar transporter subunit IIA n=1 Tax=Exiguobacterium flavidum TaxID=2184695 RepID=UPI000DF823A1|nr:PTS sugar transporter subunit IIA [Exiguobacterium flavidum]
MATQTFLTEETIQMNRKFETEAEAINASGRLLVDNGFVKPAYIESMQERHAMSSVYIGNGVAIPHGTDSAKGEVLKSGLSIMQVPEGVPFGGESAKIIIGIAGVGDEHLELLSRIAIICSDEDNVERLVAATTKREIIELLSQEVA